MLHYWSEPSLADVLSEPVVKAVMAADAVDLAALSAVLREAARKVEPDSRPSRSAGTRAAHTANQRSGVGASQSRVRRSKALVHALRIGAAGPADIDYPAVAFRQMKSFALQNRHVPESGAPGVSRAPIDERPIRLRR